MDIDTDLAPEGADDSDFALDGEVLPPETPADDTAPPEGEPKPDAAAKPPLPPEELEKRHRQTTAALREERQQRRSLEQRLQAIEAAKQAPAQEQTPRPDPQQDPIGYLEWLNNRLDAAEARSQAEQETAQQAEQRQQRLNDHVARVEEYEADFSALTPDYDKAVEHLRAARLADFTAAGLSEKEAAAAAVQDFLGITGRALAAGKDPAEVVYALAKHRGYTQDQTAEAEDKLAAVRAGQRAGNPLTGAGARANGELNLASINKLSGAAFDAAAAKFEERMLRLEGGR